MFLNKIIPKKKSEKRHLFKTITWRIVGSIDTFVLATFFSTSAEVGGWIAFTEVLTKSVLYYFHEKGWHSSNAVLEIIKAPFNLLIDGVNAITGALNAISVATGLKTISVTIPDWVPLIGGKKLGFILTKISSNQKRHVSKTLTWRLIGTLDTMLLAWFFTKDPLTGVKIVTAELVTKMMLYYLHERVWYHSKLGSKKER